MASGIFFKMFVESDIFMCTMSMFRETMLVVNCPTLVRIISTIAENSKNCAEGQYAGTSTIDLQNPIENTRSMLSKAQEQGDIER